MAIHQHRFQRRSVALVWVAILGTVLIGFLGLALDTSLVVLTGNQLENAADAAALAGAMKVRADTNGVEARALAVAIAHENKATRSPVKLDPDVDVVLGHYYYYRYDDPLNDIHIDARTFDPTSPYNAVKVVAHRTDDWNTLPLVFGPGFKVSNTGVARKAYASIGGGTGPDLLILDCHADCALSVDGDARLVVSAGACDPDSAMDGVIHVLSDSPTAACANNCKPTIVADEIYLAGCVNDKFQCKADASRVEVHCNWSFEKECVESDPLASITEPTDREPTQPSPDKNGGGHIDPGYYPTGITLNNGSIDCAPGLYVVGGPGLKILGGDFTANGVMFYILGPSGSVYLGGNGVISINRDPTIPYPGDPQYEGISIFQARDNDNPSTIIGKDNLNLSGTLYYPNNQLDARGTGETMVLGNQIIVARLHTYGTGDIIVCSQGKKWAAGNKVFLVHPLIDTTQ